MTQNSLVIVPCGKSKIWDKHPNQGPTRADEAYIGNAFKLNRRYAEEFSERWVVLSAKYGFVVPEFEIPGPYEVSFKLKKTQPVDAATLKRQVKEMGLGRFQVIVGLGGVEYRNAIAAALEPFSVHLAFPFAGLPIGKMMRATKEAIETGHSRFDQEEERWPICDTSPN